MTAFSHLAFDTDAFSTSAFDIAVTSSAPVFSGTIPNQADTQNDSISLDVSGYWVNSPTSFSVSSGSLPTGLSISAVGVITGIASTVQALTGIEITATNAAGSDASNTFTWDISASIGGGGGKVPVTDNTGAPAFVDQGTPRESNGSVAVDSASAIANYNQGLPMTANGRIAVDINEVVDRVENGGAPFSANNRLSLGTGDVTHVSAGVPYTGNSQIAVE